jgi:hypothetical protein
MQLALCAQIKRERAFRKKAEALAAEKKATHAYAVDLRNEVRDSSCALVANRESALAGLPRIAKLPSYR